jgi:ribosomal protein S12 methylthiotransferase accessory factor
VTPSAGRDEAAAAWRDKTARPHEVPSLDEVARRVGSLVSRPWGPLRDCRTMSTELRAIWHRHLAERGLRADEALLPNLHHVITPMRELGESACGLHFFSEAHARLCSLAEALERASFLVPRTLRTTCASLAELSSEDAIDPREHPLYEASQYRQEGFAAHPFDPEAPIHWIWGVDAATGAPVLVPEDLVHVSTRGHQLFQLTSSGTAVHSQYHRAVLGALYELVERDAFVLTWLHRWSRPRVTLSVDPFGLGREWATAGFELSFVDLTTDVGIPVLYVAARDPRNPDLHLNTFCAGPSPSAIALGLHRELAQSLIGRLTQRDVPKARETDPRVVASVRDHAEFYQDRSKAPLVEFLTASDAVARFADHDYFAACAGIDPAAELAQATQRLRARGFRVVVVDLTPPWMAALGLHAVRVVIPGLQPIHFGHQNRVLGGRRLYEAPRRLGLLDRDVTAAELNPWEHPFA